MGKYEDFLYRKGVLDESALGDSRWVNAADRPPRPGQTVLVMCVAPYAKARGGNSILYSEDTYLPEFGGYVPSVEFDRTVIAWMPLLHKGRPGSHENFYGFVG